MKKIKELEQKEEVEIDEGLTGARAQRAREMQDTEIKRGGGKRTDADRDTAFRLGTGTGERGKRKLGGGKYGDQGRGSAAKRRMKEEASMTTQELQLQKKKARIDRMIAQKRQQDLSKKTGGDAQPTKAMGEGMECVHNPKGKNCPVHGKEECPALTKEEASDAMKDRRMERGGVAGNVDYRRPPKNTNTNFGKKKPSGMSALDVVKAQIRAKHGKGAIIDTKKK
jgi:hypothetical protein